MKRSAPSPLPRAGAGVERLGGPRQCAPRTVRPTESPSPAASSCGLTTRLAIHFRASAVLRYGLRASLDAASDDDYSMLLNYYLAYSSKHAPRLALHIYDGAPARGGRVWLEAGADGAAAAVACRSPPTSVLKGNACTHR